MVKVLSTKINTSKGYIKTLNDVEYIIQMNVPMITIEDNSMIVFPNMEVYLAFASTPSIFSNGQFDDMYINQRIVAMEDIDPKEYTYNGLPVDGIDVINIPVEEISQMLLVTGKKWEPEPGEQVIIYRIYT